MYLGEEFNVNDLPESTSFEPIPAGWYEAEIKNAEVRTTKAGNGQYIAVQYAVKGPTHEGRTVFGNINIRNPNPTAEAIGRQQLGELIRAIGLTGVRDSDQLIGHTLQIKVAVRPETEQWGASNDVKGFKALGNSVPPAQPQQPAQQPTKPQHDNEVHPPWAR